MSTIIFKICLQYLVKLKVPVPMTLKSSSTYIFLRNSGSYTLSSIVYESKDLGSLSKLVHLQKALNTSDLKSPLKYSLLIVPGVKKKNSFLSIILIRPPNNLSTLSETIQYINIHLSSTITPTSIPTSKKLSPHYVPSFYHSASLSMFVSSITVF